MAEVVVVGAGVGGLGSALAIARAGHHVTLLERDDTFSRIVARRDGEGLRLAPVRRWRTPEALLQPIGRALARLVCEVDFRDVKACEGHACTLGPVAPMSWAPPSRWRAGCGSPPVGTRLSGELLQDPPFAGRKLVACA